MLNLMSGSSAASRTLFLVTIVLAQSGARFFGAWKRRAPGLFVKVPNHGTDWGVAVRRTKGG